MIDYLIIALIAAYAMYVSVNRIKKTKNGECCCSCDSCGMGCKKDKKK